MPTSPYRSPRGPKRFRVLVESGELPLADSCDVVICEGLKKPKHRANWRALAVTPRGPGVGAMATFMVDGALGYALIPGDCAEVDYINAAGEVLK